MRITRSQLRQLIREEVSRTINEQEDRVVTTKEYEKLTSGQVKNSPGYEDISFLEEAFRVWGFETKWATRETTGSPILYIFEPPDGWEWYFMGPTQGVPNYQVTIGKYSEPCDYDRDSDDWGDVRAQCFDSNARAFVDKVASKISDLGFQAESFDRDTRVDPGSQPGIFYGASIEGTPEPNRDGILMNIFAAGGNMATNARISFELI
jgi:hypothetical protein